MVPSFVNSKAPRSEVREFLWSHFSLNPKFRDSRSQIRVQEGVAESPMIKTNRMTRLPLLG